jgi:hypothetical protein
MSKKPSTVLLYDVIPFIFGPYHRFAENFILVRESDTLGTGRVDDNHGIAQPRPEALNLANHFPDLPLPV